nr:uncharacterized protein CFP56_06660 [Quercus suber]POF20149.1 uncharacterized protein CFP56_65128 [Quercus suber]
MEAIAKTFKLLWRTRKGFKIRDMGDHMVLFRFPEATDIDRVLQGEPWMFDKHLVALKRMEISEAIRELDFSRTSFWVQVHDLLFRSSTMGIAKEIVSIAGQVDMTASEEDISNDFNFLRLRVAVDTSKPLCRGRKITRSDGKEGWVSFKYERLPNICFWCGMLTHSDKECALWEKSRGNLKAEDQQFGSWLRASTPNPIRRTVIRVAGFEEDALSEDGEVHGEGDRDGAIQEQNRCKEGDNGNPVGEAIAVMEGPNFSDHSNDGTLNMGSTHNSLEFSNSENEIKEADFSAQLKDIDEDLAKFDNVKSSKGVSRLVFLIIIRSKKWSLSLIGLHWWAWTSLKMQSKNKVGPNRGDGFVESKTGVSPKKKFLLC